MKRSLVLKISAIVSALSGIVILLGVLYPIISYNSYSTYRFSAKKPSLISPISEKVKAAETSQLDYTRASNWFPGGAATSEFNSSKVKHYTLSIPKLDIENAVVSIGGEDLAESLIQYPGTALPGKNGNTTVFGHSIAPIFYNPKNYLAIFSTLPTLKKGDEVDIAYDGVSFKYRVESMFEVLPGDIQVLEQNVSDSFLTLVTCVPPGDPRKPQRLIVRARVVPPESSNANIGN